MSNCPSCGNENVANAKFCEFCGSSLVNHGKPSSKTNQGSKTQSSGSLLDSIIPEEWQRPTMYLVFVNMGMYVVTTILGRSFIITGELPIVLFGFSIYGFLHGLIWTPVTSIFTHGSIAHIGGNMIFLLIFGLRLEDRNYSDKGIYYAYLIIGVASGILSSVFFSIYSVSVGASGAVFGLIGVNAGIERREGDPNYKRVLMVSGILFIMSSAPNTNVFDHLIGLIIGYYMGKSEWYGQFDLSMKKIQHDLR